MSFNLLLYVKYQGETKTIIQFPLGRSVITSYTIGEKVTTIKEFAFENAQYMTSVTIGKDVTTIETYAFKECYKLNQFSVAEGNTEYTVENQGALIENTNKLIQYPYANKEISTYQIPEEITSI